MDKNLHDHMDDLFREAIEPMREQPGEDIWANVEQQLDKEEAKEYKRKFIAFRKITAILFFLLLSSIIITVISINNYSVKEPQSKLPDNNNNQPRGNNPITRNNITNKASNKESANSRDASSKDDYSKKAGFTSPVSKKAGKEIFRESGHTLLTATQNPILTDTLSSIQSKSFPPPSTSLDMLAPHLADTLYSITETKTILPLQPLAQRTDSTGISAINELSKKYKRTKNNLFPRFSVTAFLAPEFAGYNLESNEINQYDNKQKIQQRENNILSGSAGILMGYKLSKHFILQSGITYSLSRINIDPAKIYAVQDNTGNIKYRYNTSSGYGSFLPSFSSSPAKGDSLYTSNANHTLQYISMPLIASYRFEKKKFIFSPGIGVVFNFLTKATLETEVDDLLHKENENIAKLEGMRKLSYSLLFLTQLQYNFSKTWAVSAMPYFKYALAPANNGHIVKTYPYNIGLGLGVVCKF